MSHSLTSSSHPLLTSPPKGWPGLARAAWAGRALGWASTLTYALGHVAISALLLGARSDALPPLATAAICLTYFIFLLAFLLAVIVVIAAFAGCCRCG